MDLRTDLLYRELLPPTEPANPERATRSIREQQKQWDRYLDSCEDLIFAARSEGQSWGMICTSFQVHRYALYHWLNADPDRAQFWKEMEIVAAESRASDARQYLDEAAAKAERDDQNNDTYSTTSARLAQVRADHAWKDAGVLDRGKFGRADASSAVVNVNLNSLHLTAVQALQLSPPPPPPGLLEGALIPESFRPALPEGSLPQDLLGEPL